MESSQLLGCPVLSTHDMSLVAHIEGEIVEPESLKILAFRVWGAAIQNNPELGEILDVRDIRELSPIGMIVDSAEEFVNPGDVVKIDKTLALGFSLIGLKVVTKKGSRLGKVIDFIVDTETWKVQQLIVKRPAMKALVDPELVIPRREILEIDDYKITVKDEEEVIKKTAVKQAFTPNFVNPFREPDFSTSRRGNPGVQDKQ